MANDERIDYVPGVIPNDVEQLPIILQEELWKLKATIDYLLAGRKDVLHVEPVKRRDGMIVIADGTNWNPGAGAGAYLRIGGAWTKL